MHFFVKSKCMQMILMNRVLQYMYIRVNRCFKWEVKTLLPECHCLKPSSINFLVMFFLNLLLPSTHLCSMIK